MGNTFVAVVQYLRDPALVRSIQESFGVRLISVEVDHITSSDTDQDSGRTSPEVTQNSTTGDSVKHSSINSHSDKTDLEELTAGGSLKWLSSKTKTRRRIPSPPSPPPSKADSKSNTIVVESNPFFDVYFRIATELGYEPFYITFMPFVYWNMDSLIGRRVSIMWCLSMYVGQAAKQLFKIKRPASPPAIRLEQNPSLETEYGFPSTHATVGTVIPFYLLYTVLMRYEVSLWIGLPIAIIWCISVILSRIYLGVHSVLDMVAGGIISLVIFPVVLLSMDGIEYCIFEVPYMFIYWILIVIFMLYIYPVDPDNWSKDRGDTGAILGSVLGLLVGHSLVGPLPDDLATGPFPITLPSIHVMSLCIIRFVIGLLLLLPTRFIMKLLCFKLLPAIMPTNGVEEVVKRPFVELPYKLITYGSIGFNALCLSILVFEICGISRWEQPVLLLLG